jgi:phage gpG-like protein
MALIKIRDGISPDLARRAGAVSDKRPLLEAMGQAVKSLAVQAFTDPAKRAQAWAPRQDDAPHALLQKKTILRKSIRVISVTGDSVTIGSDRPYAAIHQLGGDAIPARPYLPFYKSGQITALGRQRTERALVAALRVRGL